MAAATLPESEWPNIKGYFAGSGGDGMNSSLARDSVIRLSGKEKPSVLYIGTPTYDLHTSFEKQTGVFAEAGCPVSQLRCVQEAPPTQEEAAALIKAADVILMSGGNPLYALARLKALGVDVMLREAMAAGKVMCGGSCGLICWFDAGHSDSGDPASFRGPMLGGAATSETAGKASAPAVEGATSWEYIRCPCLGFLPGLVCPHHDRVQSNGILRATDFDAMLLRHPGEYGIAVDHWAALVLEGGQYSVVAVEGKMGSVGPDGNFVADNSGIPGVWLKEVQEGAVVSKLLPASGPLSSLLRVAKEVVEDARVAAVRLANPAADDLMVSTH